MRPTLLRYAPACRRPRQIPAAAAISVLSRGVPWRATYRLCFCPACGLFRWRWTRRSRSAASSAIRDGRVRHHGGVGGIRAAPAGSSAGRLRAGRAISGSSWSMRWWSGWRFRPRRLGARSTPPATASACSIPQPAAVGRGAARIPVLDLVIYAQHVVFHRVPWLWRLHRMHHADLDIDVTHGVAFSSVRDPDLACDQDRGRAGVRHPAGRGVRFRGRAQRHVAVQPLQRVDAAVASTASCGSCW